MNGAHPFRGIWRGRGDPPAPPRWIEEFRYAYGSESAQLQVAPQPAAPPIDWLPDDIRRAFERSFSRSGVKKRPAARDWIDMLNRFEKRLVQCQKFRFHQHLPGSGSCPWCVTERKRGRRLFGNVQVSHKQAQPSYQQVRPSYLQAQSKIPTRPKGVMGPANLSGTAAPSLTSPQRPGASGNGLRNAIFTIIGVAVVSFWLFGRDQGKETTDPVGILDNIAEERRVEEQARIEAQNTVLRTYDFA